MEARCTALAVRLAKQKSRQKPKMPPTVQVRALVRKQKSRQKPKIPSTVQMRALVRKENWDPYTWEDEVEVRVTELGGVESGEGRVGPITEDPFELEMIVQDDVDDVVMWSLWQRQGKKRVPQDWALVEIERITDDRPVTLKTWVPLLGWTREGRVGNKVRRAQEFVIVKWKWYL
ncbi:hypothetical protein NDU88_001231 [Pleurodeles waltl]|uniref:Uncharacterized protein n=1 Tax=Pleurodeles waltl TaxID=8319 RepID=A0AAV7SYR9_PLEWA|nr:hypothetical protein NDU88_001231 [Pleurodeles waltl]